MEVSYNELRCKEVINLIDGRRLGKLADIIFSADTQTVLGLVLHGERKVFKQSEDIFVPWKNIHKIGDDVILINLAPENMMGVVRTGKKHDGECFDDDYIVR